MHRTASVVAGAAIVLSTAACAVPGAATRDDRRAASQTRAEAYPDPEVEIVFREQSDAPREAPTRLPMTREELRRLESQERASAEEYSAARVPHARALSRSPRQVSTALPGFVLPYPITRRNVIGTFGDCRPGGRTHAGLDIAGVGDNQGLGTPVRSMTRAKVTFIGLPQLEPEKFGSPDKRRGTTPRGPRDEELPRSEEVAPYGPVFYFTRDYGSWRSGVVIYLEVLDGPLAGHVIRYMHLGAIHPEIEVDTIVEAGQEVGLMGGTAIMTDTPHVHIDIEDARGQRVDVAPFLGLPADPTRCER